jgi:hypothetical protein
MKRRHKLSKRSSRKMFTKHAKKTHKRNLPRVPMRGGIRL